MTNTNTVICLMFVLLFATQHAFAQSKAQETDGLQAGVTESAVIDPSTVFLDGFETCTCEDELACTLDICLNNGSCGIIISGDSCLINGDCWPNGTPNPANACQSCDSADDQDGWSNAIAGTYCNADDNACTAPDTCGPGGSCISGSAVVCPDDGLACTDHLCNSVNANAYQCSTIVWANFCLIDGACQPEESLNPGNACQTCLSAESQTDWSAVEDGAGCDDGLFCTVSDDCRDGACVGSSRDCSAAADQCNVGVCSEDLLGCLIEPVEDGALCDDNEACTLADQCRSGQCSGVWDEVNCPQ